MIVWKVIRGMTLRMLININIPNSITCLRIFFIPILALLAIKDMKNTFLFFLGCSFLSDVLDGYLARLLNQTSDLGAKLDSVADTLTYAMMIFGLYTLWPDQYTEHSVFVYVAIFCYFLTILISAFKFGQIPSYHTLGAKIAAVFLAPAYFGLVLFDIGIWFKLVVVLYALVAIEELIITFILKRPEKNINSVFALFRRI